MDEGQPLRSRRIDDPHANAMYLIAHLLLGPVVGAAIALFTAPDARRGRKRGPEVSAGGAAGVNAR